MEHRIRPATLGDIDTLVQQRRRMWEDMGERDAGKLAAHDATYRAWAADLFQQGRYAAWLAEDAQGNVVAGGCVWLREWQPLPGAKDGLEAYLLSMYTAPEARGQGCAKRIVAEALAWTQAKGYPRLRLHASEMGRPLYAKLGFERTWEMRIDLAEAAKC